MIMPILREPHEKLRQVSVNIPSGINPDHLRKLVTDMVDTATHHGAHGLAAPQIACPLRAIVIALGDMVPRQYKALLNPEITWSSPLLMAEDEACLSLPGKTLKVARPMAIKLKWRMFGTFEEKAREVDGYLARVIQHEIDHLDGVLISDKAVTLQ